MIGARSVPRPMLLRLAREDRCLLLSPQKGVVCRVIRWPQAKA
jgi:hypothetical protein